MNNTVLIGNLARDPELRYTQTGKAVCNFTLAVSRGYGKDQEADFINCVAWEKTAENIANYLAKGSKVGVQGRIQVSSYDKDGEKRYKTEVVAQHVEFLGSKKDGQRQSTASQAEKEKPVMDDLDIEGFQAALDDEDFDTPF